MSELPVSNQGRIIDLSEGGVLVASDLHGSWRDYERVRNHFDDLREQRKAQYLVLNGDIIHGYGDADESVRIMDDLLKFPEPEVIATLGNHELMHIYHLDVPRHDGTSFVEPLEEEIEADRERYVGFMKRMPYAIRTKGGVLILHTGASPPMAKYFRKNYADFAKKTDPFSFARWLDHDQILSALKAVARQRLEAEYGHRLEDDFFEDCSPQMGEVFLHSELGQYMWDMFFNMNEREVGIERYNTFISGSLQTMGEGLQQRFMVTGHIHPPEGHDIIGERQLRISTSAGIRNGNKTVVLINAERVYQHIDEIAKGMQPLRR